MGGIPRRPIPTRWLVAGGAGLAVVIGLVIWVIVQAPAPGPIAVGSPTATPSVLVTPSATPSPPVTPTASASPDRTPFPRVTPAPTPVPPRPPLVLTAGYADIGPRGVVTAGSLRVRGWPGLDANLLTQLDGGTDILIRDGPVAADGYDWYSIVFAALPCDVCGLLEEGWVAVGPTGGEPTLVNVGPVRCPSVTISATLLGASGGIARRECLTGSHELTAVIDTCYEGPITPYEYDPVWLWFSCYSLFELGSDVHLDIRFPPSVEQPDALDRGSVVHLVGHFDDPAASSCTVLGNDPTPTEVDQQLFRLHCAGAFVLESIEIVDQIDLPPLF
jgi:hypothetical protein